MSVNVLGSKSFNITPDVNGNPLMVNNGGCPSVQAGTLAARPAAATVGRVYLTTDTNQIFRDTGATWVELSPSITAVVLQAVTGNIPEVSGTSLIALTNATPTTALGTQIFTQNITPTTITSRINISFSLFVDTGTNNRAITVAVFRGSTCIGVNSTSIATIARGQCLAVNIDDIPGSTSVQTYTARVGTSSAATWYVNRGSTAIFNGSLANNGYTILEFA